MSRAQSQPAVTFVMAVRDGRKTVAAALDSALCQDYDGQVQVVVVDDGSTDGTGIVLKRFGETITLIHNPISLGRSRARNQAIENVKTPFLAIHDADDVSLPDRLTKTVARLDADTLVIGGGIRLVEPASLKEWGEALWSMDAQSLDEDLQNGHTPIPHPTMLASTELVRLAGGYDNLIPCAEDLDLMLRLRGLTNFGASEHIVVNYARPQCDALSYLWNTELWRRRVMMKHGLLKSGRIWPQVAHSVANSAFRQRAKMTLRWLN